MVVKITEANWKAGNKRGKAMGAMEYRQIFEGNKAPPSPPPPPPGDP